MSGHSKWAQIKHKKALTDQRRGQLFGKLAKAIAVAARGNPDPATNARLQTAIEKARQANMPNDNIVRAIKRTTDTSAVQLQELQVEVVAPGNVAIIVSAITDNKNRTLAELRSIAKDHGAHLAQEGSLMWMFATLGVVTVPLATLPVTKRDELELVAIEAGAHDIRQDGETLRIFVRPESLHTVYEAMTPLAPTASTAIELVPSSTVTLSVETADRLDKLLEALDAHDDVQDVITNAV